MVAEVPLHERRHQDVADGDRAAQHQRPDPQADAACEGAHGDAGCEQEEAGEQHTLQAESVGRARDERGHRRERQQRHGSQESLRAFSERELAPDHRQQRAYARECRAQVERDEEHEGGAEEQPASAVSHSAAGRSFVHRRSLALLHAIFTFPRSVPHILSLP